MLPIDRILRCWRVRSSPSIDLDRLPLVVTARVGNADRLVAVSREARSRGIRPGEALADARGRVPDLIVEEADPGADAALLAALADWCDRYTPLVALDGSSGTSNGLLLDITGCAHLFAGLDETGDGERGLVADACRRLIAQGFAVRAAVADTAGAASALAHFGNPANTWTVVPPGGARAALEPLPVAALRIAPETAAALRKVGLKRIEDLLDRPRAALAARFGQDLLTRLDQALGHADEPISPRLAAPHLSVERRFFEPISETKAVEAVLLSLGRGLAEALERRGEGGRAFELVLFRADGVVRRIVVGTSRPLRAPERLLGLFAEKLRGFDEEIDAGFGFDLIRLGVLEAQGFSPTQTDMTGSAAHEDDLADLIDRLGARLGLAQVARFLPQDRHLPETRQALVPAARVQPKALRRGRDKGLAWIGDACGLPGRQSDEEVPPLVRPLRLIVPAEPVDAVAMIPDGPPLRFRWRRAVYEVAACEGPERIAPPWWTTAASGTEEKTSEDEICQPQAPPDRDYFRVEDEAGRRFWLYREGFYDGTAAPRWYLQGLFA